MLNEFVSREVELKLEEYKNLLLKWNKKINLISPQSELEINTRHILDSVQILKYIDSKNVEIIDFGSGSGLPGIILSICGIKKITLIESDSRKCAFLTQAAKISDNEVSIINSRIETLDNTRCNILTARAFSDLESIFNYAQNIIIKNKLLLHKGLSYKKEIEVACKDWLFNYHVHDSITSDEGKILEITDLKRK